MNEVAPYRSHLVAHPRCRPTVMEVTTPGTSTIIKSYRYAIDPTPGQQRALLSHIGGSRFAFNHLLSLTLANWDENQARKDAGEEVTKDDYVDTGHFGLLRLWSDTRDDVAPWWGENGASAYNDATQRLSRAMTNFYKKRAKVPRYKRRGLGESVRFTNQAVHLTDSHHVKVSRIGEVKTYESTRKLYRHLERGTGRIVAATISRRSGTWFISFSASITALIPTTRAPERIIGIDVGLSTLYTGATTDGEHVLSVANPRNYQRRERQLAHAQRQASRKQGPRRGVAPSSRWKRANARVQKVHASIAASRSNLIHATTTRLAKNFDRIVVEDLNISGMVKNHSLAKHISDAAWGEFVRQLEYKTQWYGSVLVKADRFYASSKTCSSCGHAKAKLALDERQYTCEVCDLTIDRDLNAAINLARWPSSRTEGKPTSAGTHSVAGRGGEVRPSQQQLAGQAHPDEASTEAPPQLV